MSTRKPIVAKNHDHLCKVVKESIDRYGPRCDLNHIDVSKIHDFTAVFKGALFGGDVSQWDTSSAQTMEKMFENAFFEGDISKWDVSHVTNMHAMFAGAVFNNDISNWNTCELVHANRMFHSSTFASDISRWNMSNVATTAQMFQNSPFNGEISNWDLSSLTDASAMFAFSEFNGDLSRWDLTQPGRYCNMAEMFQCCKAFSGDLSHWAITNGRHTTGMFSNNFKGVLPRALNDSDNDSSFYQLLFDNDNAFGIYLKNTPFSHAHAHVLCASAIRPPWFPPEEYEWFKEVAVMAQGIGMDPNATALLVLSQYPDRHRKKAIVEEWDISHMDLDDTANTMSR